MPGAVAAALDRLRRVVADLDAVVVAFSGGADSALLAAICHEQLGDAAVAVTAVSPSLAGAELDDCARLTSSWGMTWERVDTLEMESAAYRRNDPDRCFHCKSALMDAVAPLAEQLGAVVALGVNLDDLDDRENLKFTTDFRRLWATAVGDLFGADVRSVLGDRYTPLPLLTRA